MTNTVLYPSPTWVNSDGLQIRFPGSGVQDAVVGSTRGQLGDSKVYYADIDWHHLPGICTNEATGCIYGGLSNAGIPAGALIKSAILTVTEGFLGTSGTISLGLVQADGTELDNDGLVDAETKANLDTAGKVSTGAGALINTILASTANMYYLWATVQTTAFTAGKARLEIVYFMPTTNTPGAVPVTNP